MLTLEVSGARLGSLGSVLEVDLRLTNRGDRLIEACIGENRTVFVKSDGVSYSRVHLVHDGGCVTNFTLAAGREFVWRETFEIDSAASKVPEELEVSIAVLNPQRCDWGCAGIELKAVR